MKSIFGNQRFLAIYSGVLTLVFAATIATGFAQVSPKKATFEEIDAKRINIVEPDGTVRLVLSNKASFPGIIIRGKEHPHPNRSTAGMLFFNDEGTENGGLIFGGSKDKSGVLSSFGHLSFDEYEQDQVFTIDAEQVGDKRDSSLKLVDDPNYPIGDLIALTDRTKDLPKDQQQAEIKKFFETHAPAHTRLYIGRDLDRSVALKLKDVDGKDRIVIEVAADGTPAIKFLDPAGEIVGQLPATPK